MNARDIALLAAGALSVGMGVFHLWVPTVFRWNDGMRAAPDSLRWALSSLNYFWSTLTLLMGALVITLVVKRLATTPSAHAVLLALAAYWASHTIYLIARPFPLPTDLHWLGQVFMAFAVLQALLHAWPAWRPSTVEEAVI